MPGLASISLAQNNIQLTTAMVGGKYKEQSILSIIVAIKP